MKQLSGLDSVFLSLETADAPMHVGCLTVLDLSRAPEGFGFATVRAHIAERVRLLPSFRRRLVSMPLNLVPPFWMEDPDFLLDRHVRRLALNAPGRDAQLAELVAKLIGKTLDRSRPLWALYYVDGLSHHRAACILIIHHACVDGVAGAELLGKLFDHTPDGSTPSMQDPWDYEDTPSTIDRVWLTVRQTARRLIEVRRLLRDTRPFLQQVRQALPGAVKEPLVDGANNATFAKGWNTAPSTRFNTAIDASRSYAFRTESLSRVKAIGNALGITVNDVLLVVCAGALRSYLREKGELPEQPLVTAVPISVCAADERDGDGNRVALLGAELPTHLADVRERVVALSRSTCRLKSTLKEMPVRLLMDWLEVPAPALVMRGARLYAALLNRALYKPPVNLVISNVPGPSQPLYLAGAQVTETYPISAPYHGQALNITALSYGGQFNIGLTACRRMVPDLDHVMSLIVRSLDELGRLALYKQRSAKKAPARRASDRRRH